MVEDRRENEDKHLVLLCWRWDLIQRRSERLTEACWWFVACSNSWLVYYTHSFNFKPTLLLWRWMKGITLLHRQSFFWNVFDLWTKQTCFCFFSWDTHVFTSHPLVSHWYFWLLTILGDYVWQMGITRWLMGAWQGVRLQKRTANTVFFFIYSYYNEYIHIYSYWLNIYCAKGVCQHKMH